MEKYQILLTAFLMSYLLFVVAVILAFNKQKKMILENKDKLNRTIHTLNHQNYTHALRLIKNLDGKPGLTEDEQSMVEAAKNTIRLWKDNYIEE